MGKSNKVLCGKCGTPVTAVTGKIYYHENDKGEITNAAPLHDGCDVWKNRNRWAEFNSPDAKAKFPTINQQYLDNV